jgi:biotin carboxyl carrier protein
MTAARNHPPGTVLVEPVAASRLDGDEPRAIDPAANAVEWPAPDGPTQGWAVVLDPGGHPATAILGVDRPAGPDASRAIEVVVGGWRFELDVEDARRAEIRRRASRDRATLAGTGGPLEIRAIIPGRVAAVAVAPGDVVTAGHTLLVVEAMKMQNELRAPRDGRIDRVAVGVGETIDLGDLLVILA